MPYSHLVTRGAPLKLPDLLQLGALALLFVAMFSGKFSFERFFVEESRVEWLQLRIWLMPLAAAAWLLARRAAGDRSAPALDWPAKAMLCAVVAFHVYLIGNVLLLGRAGHAGEHVVDISMILIQLTLLTCFVRSARDLRWFLFIVEAASVCLLLFSLAGFRNPEVNGPSLTPFGGPITYYRIQFVAFCAALYLWTTSATGLTKGLHLLVAVATLFAVFTSLSKVAMAAALASVLVLIVWLFSTKRARDGLLLIAVMVAALACFQSTKGQISNRFARVDPVVSAKMMVGKSPELEILEKIYAGANLQFDDLPAEQQRHVHAIWEITRETAPDYRTHLQRFLEYSTQLTLVNDGSSRIGMALLAWAIFKDNWWLGAGLGNYSFFSANYWRRTIEEYSYPHNVLLEQLAAGGIVGFTLLMLSVVAAAVVAGRAIHDDRNLVFFAACLAFLLATSLFAGNYYDFRIFWIVAILVLASRRAPAAG